MWGRRALATCSSFITLVKNKDNARIVEAELAAIGSAQYGRLPKTPPPFISSMLSMALSIRLEDRLEDEFIPFDPNMPIDIDMSLGKNDGVTVIDVTDPSSPAYCFVSNNTLEVAKVVKVPSIPLTAEEYYYEMVEARNKELQQDVQKHINLFKGVRLIEPWMLNEAWPWDGYGSDTPGTQEPELDDTGPGIPSLTELCLQNAVEHASSEDIPALEVAISLPGLAEGLLKVLTKCDRLSDVITDVMITALDSEQSERDQLVLDLSSYSLTAEQAIRVASSFPKTQVLNLDKNPHITSATLATLRPSLPELTRLIIYDCPGISAIEVRTLLFSGFFPNLLAVYHRGYMITCHCDVATRASFTLQLLVPTTWSIQKLRYPSCRHEL
ncbi:hypothetical protein JB92DRAFT_27079 [Gautieria morchelliformis]|nr:hypothetical protein JB92DRAFT_27079 [Gautieria morchelliformis]